MTLTLQTADEVNADVQGQQKDDLITIPKEVFLACAGAQTRMKDIEHQTLILIQDVIVGNGSRVEALVAQIDPNTKGEFELMARVIIAKAMEEPQAYCTACVSLSGALQQILPPLPPGHQEKKGETFMHAILDAFQTEFEDIFTDSSSEQTISDSEEETGSAFASHWAMQRTQNRIRAIVHLAGHLYCHGLLGNGVVSQMVQDLVDNGESEAAQELLCCIGVVANSNAEPELDTVLEDDGNSDCASSESISAAEPH